MSDDRGRLLREVWRIIASHATPPVDVGDVDAWRQRVAYNAQTEHIDLANALLVFVPTASPAAIAHAIEHRLWPHQLQAEMQQAPTQRAQARLMARNAAPVCARCRDTGWIDDGDHAVRCDHEPADEVIDLTHAVEFILSCNEQRLRDSIAQARAALRADQ